MTPSPTPDRVGATTLGPRRPKVNSASRSYPSSVRGVHYLAVARRSLKARPTAAIVALPYLSSPANQISIYIAGFSCLFNAIVF